MSVLLGIGWAVFYYFLMMRIIDYVTMFDDSIRSWIGDGGYGIFCFVRFLVGLAGLVLPMIYIGIYLRSLS